MGRQQSSLLAFQVSFTDCVTRIMIAYVPITDKQQSVIE